MASRCLRSVRRLLTGDVVLRRKNAASPAVDNRRLLPSSPMAPGRDALSPSSYFFIRGFCAPNPGSSSAAAEDARMDGPSSKPQTDSHCGGESETIDEKVQVLRAALRHVPKLGWSDAAMVAGARDVGLSPAIVGAYPRKEAALVEFFMDDCLQTLQDYVESNEDDLTKTVLQERITKLVKCRLEMQVLYVSRWPQALSVQANPANLPTSFKQRAILMDEIWHAAGDHSSDMDWYAKRGILGVVYTATELYMLTDHSPGFRDTWLFLQRRVKDALNCRKTAQEARQLAQAIGAGLGSSFQAFFRR